MKTSTAFKLTKEKLWDGRGRSIPDGKADCVCYAAANAGVQVKILVVPIIEKLLAGSVYLSGWLMKHHGIDTWQNDLKLQRTRHAWLDHLIAHYESLGD